MPSATLVGRTVARYRIVERLGAGGMGEVFKAIDTALQRPIALKILPPEVVHDEDRLQRFVREAQSASALNHPGIVTIHDVGAVVVDDTNGTPQTVHYIAMELIEGQTLRTQIYGGASLQSLLQAMQQVADALAKAHSARILHRDLKPDNIMITTDGRAKVVDFGLAKLIQPEARETGSETMQMDHTREGMVIGTLGYMSPEQITGCIIDGRSDVFSFGCVLYEAVTRKRPFTGETTVDILHNIQRTPHVRPSSIDASLPRDLDRIVDRCLAKDREERYQSMKEVSVELMLLLRSLQNVSSEDSRSVIPARPRRRRLTLRIVLLAAGTALAATTLYLALTRAPDTDLSGYRFTPLQTMPEYEGFPSFSPDGRTIAYVADVDGVLQVFTRSLDAMRASQLTHSIQDCETPFWAADGREVYYISVAGDRDALWAVGVAGGTARVVLENVSAAAMSRDGRTLAFLRERDEQSPGLRLWFASPPTAPPQVFLKGDFANRRFQSGTLMFSPDGASLAAWLVVSNLSGVPREFWLIDPKTLTARRVLQSLSDIPQTFPFAWMPDSRRIVFSGVRVSDQANGAHLWMADTATGRLRALTATSFTETSPTVSPDGKKIVFTQEDLDFDLVGIPVDAPRMQTVLSTARTERDPQWSPTGNGFAYVTNRSGVDEIWFRSSQGEWERPIATNADFSDHTPTSIIFGLSFSPDGQRIAYLRRGRESRIWVSPVAGGPALPIGRELMTRNENSGSPTWSPDGSMIAFVENAAGHLRLAKLTVGVVDSRPAVILDGVTQALSLWSPNGQWLTAATDQGLLLVSPDGLVKRKISDEIWLVHTWSRDSTAIYGVRLDDSLHLVLARVSIDGRERILADLGISPPATVPLDGFSLSPDEKTLLAGLLKARGDLWMLEGFDNHAFRWPWTRPR